MRSRLSSLWHRYLTWRNAPVPALTEPDKVVRKVAIDQDDLDKQRLAFTQPPEF